MLTFSDAEKVFFDAGQLFAQELFKTWLQSVDQEILETRNDNDAGIKYEPVSIQRRSIKAKMGEFDLHRRLYKEMLPDGETRFTYLLDEMLDIKLFGKVTLNVARMFAELVCDLPYREVAKTVEKSTGLFVSHETVWNVVQELSDKIKAGLIDSPTDEKLSPKNVSVILEEADGVWINMQRDSRPKEGGKCEMKMATFYEGFKEEPYKYKNGKSRYSCVGKHTLVGFEDTETFIERKEAYLNQYYKSKNIVARVINGDGASWIKNLCTSSKCPAYYQLDPFHRNKAITMSNITIDEKIQIREFLYDKNIEGMLEYIGTLITKTTNNKARYKSLLNLYSYLSNNKDGLIPVFERPELCARLETLRRDGVIYRNLGTMESTVGNIAARRLKGRKASWSKNGAVNVATLICIKLTGELEQRVSDIKYEAKLPLCNFDLIEQEVVLSAKDIPKTVGSGYEHPFNRQLLITGASITNAAASVIRRIKNN